MRVPVYWRNLCLCLLPTSLCHSSLSMPWWRQSGVVSILDPRLSANLASILATMRLASSRSVYSTPSVKHAMMVLSNGCLPRVSDHIKPILPTIAYDARR
ncbi:hypothetical protein C8Q80DRAFT_638164 [Daedaleopsis nitida]|nr:hypothetical protein C8Q80DRAFT_638164 [Daedaleopsis nitida]